MKIRLIIIALVGIVIGFAACKKDTDSVKPWIEINGYNPVYSELGKPYSDEGAVVWDVNADGDTVNISGNLKVTSNVNIDVVGKYEVKYNADDDAGNSADEVVRIVYIQVFK
jgi:hypothetical protein